MSDNVIKKNDRRSFLRGSALFAAALGMAVVPAFAQQKPKPEEEPKPTPEEGEDPKPLLRYRIYYLSFAKTVSGSLDGCPSSSESSSFGRLV